MFKCFQAVIFLQLLKISFEKPAEEAGEVVKTYLKGREPENL